MERQRSVVPLDSLGLLEVTTERWPAGDGSYVLQLFFTATPSGQECVGMFLGSFEVADGQGLLPSQGVQAVGDDVKRLTTKLLRQVPLRRKTKDVERHAERVRPWELEDPEMDRAMERFRRSHPGRGRATIEEVLEAMDPADVDAVLRRRAEVRTERRGGRGGRPPLSEDHYREIARLYDEFVGAEELKPAREIARRYGRSIRTARNWVWEARKRGLLPPTTPGRVRNNPKEADDD